MEFHFTAGWIARGIQASRLPALHLSTWILLNLAGGRLSPGRRLLAAAWLTRLPVAVLPVNATLATSGWALRP